MSIKRLLLASKLHVSPPPAPENSFHSSFPILSYGFALGFADRRQERHVLSQRMLTPAGVHVSATCLRLNPLRKSDADASVRP